MSDIPTLAAETLLQDTHIRPASPSDTRPSTAFDSKPTPITLHEDLNRSLGLDDDDDEEDDDARSHASISSSVLNYDPHRRGPPPKLPDLRFEQSYLASIVPAEGVWWKIALITLKDQVLFPLIQGLAYNLFVTGWRAWNRGAKFRGASLGARVRRWWWGVNNWKLPREK
ncbi:hypothetical protein RUND412_001918 [Rhizina undulata]